MSSDKFIKLCKAGQIDNVINYWKNNKENINIRKYNDEAFSWCCINGHFNIAKWIISQVKIDNDIPTDFNSEIFFLLCCETGNKQMAEWLWDLFTINLHSRNDWAFRFSCLNGHLETAKWLWELSLLERQTPINLSAHKHHAFKQSCQNGQLSVVKWLVSLNPNCYSFTINNDNTITPNIIKSFSVLPENIIFYGDPNENCQVCHENKNQLILHCGHLFCFICFDSLNEDICPFCRKPFIYNQVYQLQL